MAFDWSSLIDLATMLRQQAATASNPEAYLRSAANRAYYGAYGHACQYATHFLQYRPKVASDEHGRLREHLRRKKRKAVAECLNRLRDCRNDADYLDELPWPDLGSTIDEVILLARQVLAALPPPQSRPF